MQTTEESSVLLRFCTYSYVLYQLLARTPKTTQPIDTARDVLSVCPVDDNKSQPLRLNNARKGEVRDSYSKL